MRLQDFDTGERYTATVLDNHRITETDALDAIHEIQLEVAHLPFSYEIGQCIGVITPGSEEIGHPNHFRLYSLAEGCQHGESGNPKITLCVKRCHYVDEYSGEAYDGIASNYLCDLAPGDKISINGPFGQPFVVPENKSADLFLVGMGTGIAPFRALVKHIYHNVTGWRGKVTLFYGAKSGLDLAYMNSYRNDFTQYYDEDTFAAVEALSPRAHWAEPVDLHSALNSKAEDILHSLETGNGYVYIAGRLDIKENLDELFAKVVGDEAKWLELKEKLLAENRWAELVY